MTGRVTVRCPECNPDGMEVSPSAAESIADTHNESKHDGEPVAEIDEGDD